MVKAVDGSHIAFKTVPVSEQIECFNRKQDYSIMIQGVADVGMGYPGSIQDSRILHLSKLEREIGQGTWLNSPLKRIGDSEIGPLLGGDPTY